VKRSGEWKVESGEWRAGCGEAPGDTFAHHSPLTTLHSPLNCRWALVIALTLVGLAPAGGATKVEVDSARHQDPKIELPPPIVSYSPKLKPLWLAALAHDEVDLKRQAAHTIALAHQRGMPDLADAATPLMEALDAPDQHPVVMLAAAKALIVLDARQAAPLLFKHAAKDGLDMAQMVEPVLASWDYEPIRQVWRDRLSAPRVPRRLLFLAIRGVAAVSVHEAEPRLRELATRSEIAPDVRLEAARALGHLKTEGLEEVARSLAADKSPEKIVDRLVAASLLSGHQGDEAESLLLELAVDEAPSVAAIALARLLEIDHMLVIPIADATIANDDANVRHLGARAVVAWHTPEAVSRLGPMLDDPHPDVRKYVRRSLLEMASDEQLGAPVLKEALDMLATERWRGLEQASLMIAALDHKPAAGRLVELLDFQRPEVFITAAWALRKLAVPATLDAMFDKACRETKRTEASHWAPADVCQQLCQLIEAFGEMTYTPAEPLLRKHIPKDAPYAAEVRAAAIWSLGHLYAGKPEPKLTGLLVGRLSDVNSLEPEAEDVRLMSAVSLGRMNAGRRSAEASLCPTNGVLPALQLFMKLDTLQTPVGYACAWAIHQITGEPIPKPEPRHESRLGWFLDPLD